MARKGWIAIVAAALVAALAGWFFLEQRRVDNWAVTVATRAPVYESDEYPYATGSKPNKVVGFLEAGEQPHVLSVSYGYDWIIFEVQLPSGARGYLFDADAETKRK